jgi:hypothetical protein
METQYQTNFDNFSTPEGVGFRGLIKKEEIKGLFMRLKKAHEFYKLYESDPEKHEEILVKSEPLISELERLGVNRSFSEALLFFGKEFVDFEFGLTTERVKNRSESEISGDVVSKAEEIFGVKAEPMTPGELKVYEQVPDNALAYTVKDGKPEVLAYKKIEKE